MKTKSISLVLLISMINPVFAQEQEQTSRQTQDKKIHMTTTGLCLQPTHPQYQNLDVKTSYETIRECVLDGGRQDTRIDNTQINQTIETITDTTKNANTTTNTRDKLSTEESLKTIDTLSLKDIDGNPIDIKTLPPQTLIELQNNGQIPQDVNIEALIKVFEQQAPKKRTGPKEITLPKNLVYSEDDNIFRDPAFYIGRSRNDFKP